MTRRWPLRPTHPGWLVLQVAGLLLLIGLFKGINLLTLLACLLFAAILFNLAFVLPHTAGLVLHRRLPRPLVAGSAVALEARLTGTTRAKRLGVLVLDEGPKPAVAALVPRLVGTESVAIRPTWTPPRRGRHKLGPVVAVGRYPFGLVERRRELAPAEEVIVWPALGEVERGKLTRQLSRRRQRQPSRTRPRPERTAQQEIYGLRPFRTGDSTRLIHWRTSARRGELMVREYEDIPPESMAVVFDATAACSRAAFEQAVTFAATVCWEWCRHRGVRLVLAVLGAEPAVLGGTTGPELGADLLDLLAVIEPAEPTRTPEFLAALGREVGRGDGVLLVSGAESPLELVLPRHLGLGVLALTAGDLDHLEGYTPPAS